MSGLKTQHFSESILCHPLWDVFFTLTQRSSLNKRPNPLGLYHPHPLFPAFSKKRQHGFSQQVPLLCLCGQSLGSAEVQTCQSSLPGTLHAVVTLVWLWHVITDWSTMAGPDWCDCWATARGNRQEQERVRIKGNSNPLCLHVLE